MRSRWKENLFEFLNWKHNMEVELCCLKRGGRQNEENREIILVSRKEVLQELEKRNCTLECCRASEKVEETIEKFIKT